MTLGGGTNFASAYNNPHQTSLNGAITSSANNVSASLRQQFGGGLGVSNSLQVSTEHFSSMANDVQFANLKK